METFRKATCGRVVAIHPNTQKPVQYRATQVEREIRVKLGSTPELAKADYLLEEDLKKREIRVFRKSESKAGVNS